MRSPPWHGRLKGGLALSAALALALWARQSARAAERRFPPSGKFIGVDGVRLHYIEPIMLRPWQLKASAEESGFLVPAVTDLAPRYKDIPVPVEILAGADDKPFKPGNQSVRLHKLIPGSRLQLLPGVGHMLHYGRIAEIVEAVDRITRAAIVPGESSTRSAG